MTFTEFWADYPRKRSKADARKAWTQTLDDGTTPADHREQIRAALTWQVTEWMCDGGKFIPYPATYLRGERWEDEPDPQVKLVGRAAMPKQLRAVLDDTDEWVAMMEDRARLESHDTD